MMHCTEALTSTLDSCPVPAHQGQVLFHVLEEQTTPQHQPWGKIEKNMARDVQPLATFTESFPPSTEIEQETG